MGNLCAWTVLDTELVQDGNIIRLHRDRVRAPRSGSVHPYWRIEADEWVAFAIDLQTARNFRELFAFSDI
jgi:hypothetical protein